MKKILMLTTGGTITSVSTKEGLIPASSKEIKTYFKHSYEDIEIVIKDILLLDSSNIQPEEWKIIAKEIFLAFNDYQSVIVTHGTDTMAYTTSMMSFMLKNPPIPIVFTGSQLPISHPLTDAISNLHTAITMCLTNIPGIFLAFDRKIILGCRAVKVRTTGFNAFESINRKMVGTIDGSGLILNKNIIPASSKTPELDITIECNVFLLKLTPGTNPNIIDILINSGCKGIVIEAYGAGGISFIRRDFVTKIEHAINNNIPVIVCSQCLYEKPNFSVYQVGKKVLDKGAIEALDMTTEAAITKLMWALGKTSDIEKIRNIFKTNLAGEIYN